MSYLSNRKKQCKISISGHSQSQQIKIAIEKLRNNNFLDKFFCEAHNCSYDPHKRRRIYVEAGPGDRTGRIYFYLDDDKGRSFFIQYVAKESRHTYMIGVLLAFHMKLLFPEYANYEIYTATSAWASQAKEVAEM